MNTQLNFPIGKLHNTEMHHQDACQTGIQCYDPHWKLGAGTLTCINLKYIKSMIVNLKCVTEFTCHKVDSEFCILHQYDASLTGLSGANIHTTEFPGCYSVPFMILPCTHKAYFFPFVTFTLG